MGIMSNDNVERAALARRACGDIPARFCTVAAVDISGDAAMVWLLTNQV